MNIIITEDLQVFKAEQLPADAIEASNCGVLTLINIDDPDLPTIHKEDDTWIPLLDYPYET